MDDIEHLKKLAGVKADYITDLIEDLSDEQMFYLIQELNKKYNLRQNILDWRMKVHLPVMDVVPSEESLAKGRAHLQGVRAQLDADQRENDAEERRAKFRIVDPD